VVWDRVAERLHWAALNADAVAARYPDDLAVQALREQLAALVAIVTAEEGDSIESAAGGEAEPSVEPRREGGEKSGKRSAPHAPRRPIRVVARGVLNGSEDWETLIR